MKTVLKPQKPKKISDETLDVLVRTYVKLLAGGYCRRCKRYFGESLQAAHLYRRNRKTVRWDLRNVHTLCPECHKLIDNDCIAETSFMYEVLSSSEIADLSELANKTIKQHPIDREEIKASLKAKIRFIGSNA